MAEILDETDRPGVASSIEAALTDSLRGAQPQALNSRLTLTIRDRDGGLAAGLVASTSYGWMLIKGLWVAEARRRQGFGRKLMDRATRIAAARGCHALWLDTSSPDSLAFYRRLGFEPFGELRNPAGHAPAGHMRWFLRRSLTRPTTKDEDGHDRTA